MCRNEAVNRPEATHRPEAIDRPEAINTVVSDLCRRQLGHPVRVAIDGITASGKSTVAREVADAIRGRGRTVVHLTMDGFHNHREQRYRRGRTSAEGYYWDAYNFDALIENVLRPLGPGGNRHYRNGVIDLSTDCVLDEPPLEAPADSILVVDGTFLLRGSTAAHWDVSVFVDTDFGVARARGIKRDADQMGGPIETGAAYDTRYHAACKLYLDTVEPRRLATRVFGNNDVDRPVLKKCTK